MQLTLTDEEASTLHDLLSAYLPELRRETARADDRALRHELVTRQNLVEKLVNELARARAR